MKVREVNRPTGGQCKLCKKAVPDASWVQLGPVGPEGDPEARLRELRSTTFRANCPDGHECTVVMRR
jgi:hypothetical protein